MEAELRDPQTGQVALMRWARGANLVTQDAKVSAIGDAWQLPAASARTSPRRCWIPIPSARDCSASACRRLRSRPIALCAQRYGMLRLAGRSASFFLPLAPGASDPGPPAAGQ